MAFVRSISPADEHARSHSPRTGEEIQGHNLSVEELCSCGNHHSPYSKPRVRKPLPFQGTAESGNYRSFNKNERADAFRAPNGNAAGESRDSPFRDMRNTGFEQSMYSADFVRHPLEYQQPPPEVRVRKPLPFQGKPSSSDYRLYSSNETRGIRGEMTKRGESPDSPLRGRSGGMVPSEYTQRYQPHQLERQPPPPEVRVRKPLPFQGSSEANSRFRGYSPDEQRSAIRDPAFRNTKTNLWPGNDFQGHTTSGVDYTPKPFERQQPPPEVRVRKPLPFNGSSLTHDSYNQKQGDHRRDLCTKAKFESPDSTLKHGLRGYFESTFHQDFKEHRCLAGELLQQYPHPDSLPEGRERMYFDNKEKMWY